MGLLDKSDEGDGILLIRKTEGDGISDTDWRGWWDY